MKSKKALELIECEHFEGTTMDFSSVKIFARTAVGEAEQEMIEKACEIFCNVCSIVNYNMRNIEDCRVICSRYKDFIEKLNNK